MSNETLKAFLEAKFKEKISSNILERFAHSSDMGFSAQLVWDGIKIKIIPDYVFYPQTVEDVIEIVKIANEYKIPLVPYGRGTNRYGNAVPAEGGITVDFSHMNNIEINQDEKIAIVEPGATWKEVDLVAQQKGLQLRTFPSSYDSTVGGGIAGDALGIGSYEYGFICDNVTFVDMVNPKGELVRLEGKNLAIVCGAEGTTGLIVKAGIKLRPFSNIESLGISIDDFETALKAIEYFYKEAIPAWHVQLRGPAISTQLVHKYHANLEENKWNMIIMYPHTRANIVEPKIHKIATALKGNIYEVEWIGWWSFNHGAIAAFEHEGTVIHQHGLVPYSKLPELVNGLKSFLGELGNLEPDKGFDLDIDLERREILLVNAFTISSLQPYDRKLIYDLAKNTLMFEKFVSVGGSMLSVGMFMHRYAEQRLNNTSKTFQEMGVNRYEVMKKYKDELDPEELFNPGKVFIPRKRGTAVLEIFGRQQEALRFRFGIGFAKALAPGGEVNGYKIVKKYLDIFTDYAMKCIDCAMCVTVCPQFDLIPNLPYAPKGMFDFVKGAIAYYELNGSIDIPDITIAEISGCHKCGLCDGVCPAKIPISTLLIKLNSLVVKKIPEEKPLDVPIIPTDANDIVDKNSDVVVWGGRYIAENPNVAIVALELLKKLNIKVNVIDTTRDSGFLDYISGNEEGLNNKINENLSNISNALQIITLTPEDYKVFSDAYSSLSKLRKIDFIAEITPIELLLLKSLVIDGNGEEINLHVACFSTSYANDIIKRLKDMNFKVKRVDGCSGAILEKSGSVRADKIAKALTENYKKIVTLCPLAAIKFRSLGVEAETLTEYLAKKAGIKVEQSAKMLELNLSEDEKKSLVNFILGTLKDQLTVIAPQIADTVTFVSSGADEYEKIIKDIIKSSVDKAVDKIRQEFEKVIEKRREEIKVDENLWKTLRIKYFKDLSLLLLQIDLEPLASNMLESVKKLTTEEFDTKVFLTAIIQAVRESLTDIRNKLIEAS